MSKIVQNKNKKINHQTNIQKKYFAGKDVLQEGSNESSEGERIAKKKKKKRH